MPHLDGLGVCRAVRTLVADPVLPVIIWSSAEADDSRVLEAIALGRVEFFSKSHALLEITAALRRILRLTDAERGQPAEGAAAVGGVQGIGSPLSVEVAA